MSEQPSTAEHPYTIVVGVSATSKSVRALTWAHAQARQNNGRVVAVRAWRVPNPQATPSGESAGRIAHGTDVEQAARASLEEDVAAALGADHTAEIRLLQGGKWTVLVKAAAEADLLVVDAPRRLLAGPMFAHQLIYAATCPVVVMPPDISGEPPPVVARFADALGRSFFTAGRPGYRPPLIQ